MQEDQRAADGDADAARRFGPVRKELATFVELFALSGLLIVQPVLDFLGWNDVDPNSDDVPWTTAAGTVTGRPSRTVAIAVNGRIGGLALTTAGGRYYAMLAPTLFRAGKNEVTAYLVSGSPRSPRFVAIVPASPGDGGTNP